MRSFEEKVLDTISREDLLAPGQRVVVALSGGRDSVAELCALGNLGYECAAVHVNFHLRGEESLRDEAFVRSLCGRMGVELFVHECDAKGYAARSGQSVEMAARELRYNYFALAAGKLAAPVAVAHHRDDNVETMLLNLARGTGLRGLCGMAYKSRRAANAGTPYTLVRPLLDVSRAEVQRYLQEIKQPYVDDSTNFVADVKRNKLRLEIIPLLAELNPSIGKTMQDEIRLLSSAYKIYRQSVDSFLMKRKVNIYGDEILETKDLGECASLEALLFEWLSPRGFNSAQISQMAGNPCGNELSRAETDDYLLARQHGRYALIKKATLPVGVDELLPEDGEVVVAGGKIEVAHTDKVPDRVQLCSPQYAFLRERAVYPPLRIRNVRPGDAFSPFGMRGRKLVGDFLKDAKVPVEERLRQLVVYDKEKIVWLVGRRTDNRVRVEPGESHIIRIKVSAP